MQAHPQAPELHPAPEREAVPLALLQGHQGLVAPERGQQARVAQARQARVALVRQAPVRRRPQPLVLRRPQPPLQRGV